MSKPVLSIAILPVPEKKDIMTALTGGVASALCRTAQPASEMRLPEPASKPV